MYNFASSERWLLRGETVPSDLKIETRAWGAIFDSLRAGASMRSDNHSPLHG